MTLDFTRPNLFRAFIYFLLLYALFRCREWFAVEPGALADTDAALGIAGRWMAGFFEEHTLWKEIFLFVFALFCAFSVTRILSRNQIYLERTFIPVLIFPLVAFGYGSSAVTPVVLLAAWLLIFAVDHILRSYKREAHFSYFLNASVALGAAFLIYPPSFVFFLLLPAGFVLYRQSWRSVVISLAGYFFPLALFSYIRWGMGHPFGEAAQEIIALLTAPATGELFIFQMDVWDYILTGLFLFLTFLGVISFFRRQVKIRRRALRGFVLFSWIFLFCLVMIALPCRSIDILLLVAVPLSAVIPAAFNRKSGWFPNLLYLLMLWSVLIYNLTLLFPRLG